MADLVTRLVRPGGTVSPVLPRLDIEAQVLDSKTGQVLQDYQGANVLAFWPLLRTTLQDPVARDEFEALIVPWLLRKRAGL